MHTHQPLPPIGSVISRFRFPVPCSLFFFFFLLTPAPPASPIITLASSLTKVPREGDFPQESEARLEAARGEYENIQVVVRAPDAHAIASLTATAGPLSGPAGAQLPAPRLYRVAYVQVQKPSNIEGRAGLWPDPLIPATDAYAGEHRNAFPVAVPAGKNQPIWLELFVPRQAPPGSYRGTLTVRIDGTDTKLDLALRVRAFALPRDPSLPLVIGYSGLSLERAHHGRYLSDEDNLALSARYALALLRHRASAFGGTMLPPPFRMQAGKAQVDWSRYDAELGPLLDGTADPSDPGARTRLTDLRLSPQVKGGARDALIAAWARHFAEHKWQDRLFDYVIDEPKPSDFARACDRARAVGRAHIVRLITHPIDPGLRACADIFAPELNLLDDKPASAGGDPHLPPRSAYTGHRLFWYQACRTHGCDILGGVYFTGWPSYMIDAPTAVAHRIQEWLSFRYGVEGELYYNSVEAYEHGDPWRSVYAHGGNGDGTLFYPGTAARIGGTTDIPIESIRLKILRDGLEDHDYLVLAPRVVAQVEVARIAARTFQWNHDPRALLGARARLAQAIEEQRRPVEQSSAKAP